MTLNYSKWFLKEIDALEVQCEYALNEKLPVVLHTRNSINETIDVISKYKGRLKGVFHCFDGDYEQLKKITNLGFKIGLGGIITFKNSKLKEVISRINISDIVLETSCNNKIVLGAHKTEVTLDLLVGALSNQNLRLKCLS